MLNVDGADLVKKAGIQLKHIKNCYAKVDIHMFYTKILYNEVMGTSSELINLSVCL